MSKILFHHIPKTGGTSLVAHAHALFGDAVCPSRYACRLDDKDITDPSYVFYHGHFSRSTVLRFRELCPDAFIFTFVRHPFNRTLSQYYNWVDTTKVRREFEVIERNAAGNDRVRMLRDKFEREIFQLSLLDFLTSDDPDVLQGVDNVQAQFMTDPDERAHARYNKTIVNALLTYDFIGLLELYAPCLRIIEAKCDLPAGCLDGESRKNANRLGGVDGRYRINLDELALLETRSVYDVALFHVSHALLLRSYADRLPRAALDIDALARLPIAREDLQLSA